MDGPGLRKTGVAHWAMALLHCRSQLLTRLLDTEPLPDALRYLSSIYKCFASLRAMLWVVQAKIYEFIADYQIRLTYIIMPRLMVEYQNDKFNERRIFTTLQPRGFLTYLFRLLMFILFIIDSAPALVATFCFCSGADNG